MRWHCSEFREELQNPQTFIAFQETESETSHRIHGMLATIAANVAKRTSDLGRLFQAKREIE